MEPRIVVAAIGAPHGVRGELRVKTFTAEPLAATEYGPLALEDGRTLAVERVRPARGALIVKFRGIDDRDSAAALNGQLLSVPRAALPPLQPDEFYHADLIGLTAWSPAGEEIGRIAGVVNFGAGDILDITTAAGSLLVPFTREAVPEIDIAGARLIVLPPPPAEEGEEKEAR